MAQTASLQLYNPRASQLQVLRSDARFKTVNAGRRWGKTLTALNWLLKGAWENGGQNWWVAPIYRQAKIPWRRMLRAMPREAIKESSKSELRIELLSGGVVQFVSADNPENLRGEGIGRLVIDEAARVDREAWEGSLRPAISDTGGRVLFISTPKARNWFFEIWARGKDRKAWPEYESWSFPSADNPKIPREDIEQAQRTLPRDVFQQEYMAEFLEGHAGVFRKIDQCIMGVLDWHPIRGRYYFMGVDLAKHQDFTVISVTDDSGQVVWWERFNLIDWPFQKSKIQNVALNFNAAVLIDSTGIGDPIFDDLARMGLRIRGYKFTSESKKALIEALVIAMENRQITFPDIPELINELRIFEYQMSPSGNLRYSAPAGYHDDFIISLALANWIRQTQPVAWEMPYQSASGEMIDPTVPMRDPRDLSRFAIVPPSARKNEWD